MEDAAEGPEFLPEKDREEIVEQKSVRVAPLLPGKVLPAPRCSNRLPPVEGLRGLVAPFLDFCFLGESEPLQKC